jgi:hypothetical protein
VMLGNVGSHSCTIIWLKTFSFGLHPSKRHHDIGFAEFPGFTEYIELRTSKNSLELGGFLGIAEPTDTLECLHRMELHNSEAILFHPRDFGPGCSHGAGGQEWGNKSSRGRAGLEGYG